MIKKRINGERGITLVALTVTIVIMAILVAVVVKVSTDNDLIDTALNATDQFDQATVFQALSNILVSERSVYENGFITEEQMWDNIETTIIGKPETEETEFEKELSQYGRVDVRRELEGTGLKIDIISKEGKTIKSYQMDKNRVTEL